MHRNRFQYLLKKSKQLLKNTVCPRISYPFYIVTYYSIKTTQFSLINMDLQLSFVVTKGRSLCFIWNFYDPLVFTCNISMWLFTFCLRQTTNRLNEKGKLEPSQIQHVQEVLSIFIYNKINLRMFSFEMFIWLLEDVFWKQFHLCKLINVLYVQEFMTNLI